MPLRFAHLEWEPVRIFRMHGEEVTLWIKFDGWSTRDVTKLIYDLCNRQPTREEKNKTVRKGGAFPTLRKVLLYAIALRSHLLQVLPKQMRVEVKTSEGLNLLPSHSVLGCLVAGSAIILAWILTDDCLRLACVTEIWNMSTKSVFSVWLVQLEWRVVTLVILDLRCSNM